MDEPKGHQLQHLAFLWPALAAASANDLATSFAQQFVDFAVGTENARAPREPQWATPNTIALELKTVRLRDFSTGQEGTPVLLCAPFALHGATVADFAAGHSLVAALHDNGLKRLFVTDWRSATPAMRYLGIDDYLADLNVLVDQLGGYVDLVGLCQGGWMSLLYAARFPAKIRKLVLAGAPIDIAAAPSGLSALVDASPFAVFQELVKLGDGRVFGHKVLKFWAPQPLESGDIHQLLQSAEAIGSSAFAELEAKFRDWFAWTVDLPGNYYLEVVDRLYKHNAIATGQFVALGQSIDLAKVQAPIFLLAARDDELVAPRQLFATEKLVGSLPENIRKVVAPCRHLGLFMGMIILREYWTKIVRWVAEPEFPKRGHATMHSRQSRH